MVDTTIGERHPFYVEILKPLTTSPNFLFLTMFLNNPLKRVKNYLIPSLQFSVLCRDPFCSIPVPVFIGNPFYERTSFVLRCHLVVGLEEKLRPGGSHHQRFDSNPPKWNTYYALPKLNTYYALDPV